MAATAAAQEVASVAPLPQSPPPTTAASASLKPVALADSDAKVAASIARLERIDRIAFDKVLKRTGHVAYVMEVFLRSTSSSDSNDAEAQKPPGALAVHANPLVGQQLESNYQVDHRFSEFAELRVVLLYVSRLQGGKAHAKSCPLCRELLKSVECSLWQPSLWTRLVTTQRMRRELLSRFMAKIVAVAVSSKTNERHACDAHYHVPVLVERFLRKPADGVHGII